MPNWCENKVEIRGDKKQVKELVTLMTKEFDYNKLIPMPEELRETALIVTAEEYRNKMKSITQEMADNLIKKYGYDNWYDWSINNWGVKWNSSDTKLEYEENSDYAVYEFLSPWGPPDKIHSILSNKFSELNIEWSYRTEGETQTVNFL